MKTSAMEIRKHVADAVAEGEKMIEIIGDEGDLLEHRGVLEWMLPQARMTLADLRARKPVTWESPQMLPVHTIVILIDHIRYIMEEELESMSDEEYDQMMERLDEES